MENYNWIIEEWKAAIDLYNAHDSLKQQRIKHILTLETAFIAVFGLISIESFIRPDILAKFAFMSFSILLALVIF